jgi:hypothetical protein
MSSAIIERILSPLSTSDFVNRHWGREPIHIPGDADKLADLLPLERFLRIMETTTAQLDGREPHIRAVFRGKGGRNDHHQFRIKPNDVKAAYEVGATVAVTHIDLLDVGLHRCCQQIRAELGYPGRLRMDVYWSPDGSGFNPHFDCGIPMTLQLGGAKTWRFSKVPALVWPKSNAFLDDGKPSYGGDEWRADWELAFNAASMTDWQEVRLEPGHVLVLPAGAWHTAAAHGASYALTLGFQPPMSAAQFVGSMLAMEKHASVDWRGVPPLLGGGDVQGGPNARALQYLDGLLDDAAKSLAAWREAPAGVLGKWAADQSGLHSSDEPSDGDAIDAETELELMRSVTVVSRPSDTTLRAFANGKEIHATGAMADVLRAAIAARTFIVGKLDVGGGVSAAERMEFLHTLVRAKVLRRRAATMKLSLGNVLSAARAFK